MRMVGLFFMSFLFSGSSAMLATLNPRISSRTGVVDFLKSARATVSESCTSSRLDLGISFAISGMTFYQLANVRSRKDQLIRAIDARMSRRPYLFEADRTLDKLWQAREKVKVSGDKLNEALKKSMIVGAILDGAVKYLDYLKKFADPFVGNNRTKKRERLIHLKMDPNARKHWLVMIRMNQTPPKEVSLSTMELQQIAT